LFVPSSALRYTLSRPPRGSVCSSHVPTAPLASRLARSCPPRAFPPSPRAGAPPREVFGNVASLEGFTALAARAGARTRVLPDTAATLFQLVSFDLARGDGDCDGDGGASAAPSAVAGGGDRAALRYDRAAFGGGESSLIIGARVATARSLDLDALGGGVAPGEFGVLELYEARRKRKKLFTPKPIVIVATTAANKTRARRGRLAPRRRAHVGGARLAALRVDVPHRARRRGARARLLVVPRARRHRRRRRRRSGRPSKR